MKLQSIIKLSVLSAALALSSTSVLAAKNASKSSAGFSDGQTKQIEKIVHEYLVKNPEVLIEAGRVLQQRQRDEAMNHARKAIVENSSQLFQSNSSPVTGNASGDVNLVEFFDYQCIHCKHMTKTVGELLKTDKKVRVIYKQFPIFGKSSEFAAKAALAANKQGKFSALHEALMDVSEKLDDAKVLAIAKQAGLDVAKLQKDMQDPAVAKELMDNQKLAESMGIMATPVFVLGSNPPSASMKTQFVPGAVALPMLEGLIKQIR